MIISAAAAEEIARNTANFPTNRKWNSKDLDKRFRSIFGASSELVANLWNRIDDGGLEAGAGPEHLLWGLVFLKVYSAEEAHCAIAGWPAAKTFRKWSWYFVEKIASLKPEVIVLGNRFDGWPNGIVTTNCFISVGGTDCPVYEPWPFHKSWFSKKFNGPALKYEVAVCIKTGYIVWVNGPFKGSTNDGTIFKDGLQLLLCADEAEIGRAHV